MEPEDYRRMREEAGLSQVKLAQRMGFSRTHVNRVELGHDLASERYLACFLAAVQGKSAEAEAVPHARSLLRSRKVIEASGDVLNEAHTALLVAQRELSRAQKACAVAAEQAEILSGDVEETPRANKFDPATSSSDDLESVSRHVTNVVIEMLLEYNFINLEATRLDAILSSWMKHISAEIRKAKRRGEAA